MRILSAQEAREVDRVAMQEQGVPGVTLMENAGRAVAEKVDSMADGGKVGILCGKGNNGGDGYACASFLNEMEIECELISIIPEGEITGDAKHFYDECKGKDIRFCHAQHVKEVDLGHFNLIVDGLLGTGISGDVKPDSAEWIEAMNSASSAILSIDIPSGINGTNGFVCGTAVQATATVTMEFLKQGIVVQPGKSLAGEITVADLGYPATAFENLDVKKKAFDEDFARKYLSPPPAETYKHRQGKLLVIAGSKGFTGAACLAAESAVRSGAGLVVAAVPESLNSIFEKKLTETMTLPIPDDGNGFLNINALDSLHKWFGWSDALLMGPGVGTDPQVGELVKGIVHKYKKPLVLDADGLGHIKDDLDILSQLEDAFILTPHHGEASRLFGVEQKEISDDPFKFATEAVGRSGGVLVLKGAPTLTAFGNEVIANTSGHQGLATGGTGDVLAGIISSFLCQGMPIEIAAQLAVFVHGRAADLLLEERGYRGLAASDLIEKIPSIIADYETGR